MMIEGKQNQCWPLLIQSGKAGFLKLLKQKTLVPSINAMQWLQCVPSPKLNGTKASVTGV